MNVWAAGAMRIEVHSIPSCQGGKEEKSVLNSVHFWLFENRLVRIWPSQGATERITFSETILKSEFYRSDFSFLCDIIFRN